MPSRNSWTDTVTWKYVGLSTRVFAWRRCKFKLDQFILLENMTQVESILAVLRKTVQNVYDELGMGYGACQRSLTEDLNIYRIVAKNVVDLLINEQQENRVNACTKHKHLVSDDINFLLSDYR